MENKNENTKITPMMRQYLDIKNKHPEEILFFRLGDFYEMFFDDAVTASRVLDIALTSRHNDIPMCGVPYHACDSYIARLIKAGFRVAICEQMETTPSEGNIVKRNVIRIITPGTVIEPNLLQSDDNNFLGSVVFNEKDIGLAFIDISTGYFTLSSIDRSFDLFRGEIAKNRPREIILKADPDRDEKYLQFIKNNDIPVYKINEWYYDIEYSKETIKDVYRINTITGLGLRSDTEIMTAGSILQYLKDTHKKVFDHLKHPRRLTASDYMFLDDATISNLELVQNQQDRTKNRTLFSVLNYTKTAMGRRALESNILHPLLGMDEINRRLSALDEFFGNSSLTGEIRESLKNIHDIERILSRLTIGRTFPRDFIALSGSIRASLRIKKRLDETDTEIFKKLSGDIPDTGGLSAMIEAAIDDDPALTPEHGRVIRNGCNSELDHLYELKTDAKSWILQYQEEEKQKLGIPTLKVRYNRVVGYFIEISKGQIAKVPAEYFRKQTLVGSERYTTDELQKFESEILSSSDKIIEIEKQELDKLLREVHSLKDDLQKMAAAIGEIDFYASLAISAIENKFVRPAFNEIGVTSIKAGRHPVVEKHFTSEVFIPNDVTLDCDENIIKLITGPNMSGKSTYIRMTAIIQLMAQIGSFVPARSADLSVVDRIFTRIGASDNISRGESTFLVEMNETAIILNNATGKSLIIMDEIGRGTSTYDGLSIAWAIVEYIQRYLKAKTLFATHYHELTKLGEKKGIVNYNVLVKEHLSGVDFLHRVVPGSADKSYGIHVAKLAGIPKEITSNANNILSKMEKRSRGIDSKKSDHEEKNEQLDIFNAANHIVIQAIKNISLDTITPLDAINELNRLKKLIE
ncbi:MAG: DNA mismatch repair protein MutS [Spirochaetes bacterium]|nr:DNA mismatch repair protein MutS [Spirochaetota bacterium]